jgi:sugar phosphate isomerase/epimerase
MKLSFSTLGCPAWTLDQIVRRAAQYGFDGIAFRGLNGELDLTKVDEFSPSRRKHTLSLIKSAGLVCNMMLTSTRVMLTDPAELAASLQNAKDHIDLASDMEAPAVRIFGGAMLSGLSHAAATARAGERLRELGRHAEGKGVKVLFETHDDWVRPELVRRVIEHADHPDVRVLWDVHHPYRIAGIPIAEVWNTLGRWVEAVDIKDSRIDPSARLGYRYVKLGEGDVPIPEALTLLAGAGYRGWLNFEWEKRWHPEIEEPEVSFPHFRQTMTKMLAAIR